MRSIVKIVARELSKAIIAGFGLQVGKELYERLRKRPGQPVEPPTESEDDDDDLED